MLVVFGDKYQISDQDVDGAGTSYYGYVNKEGNTYVIMKAIVTLKVTNYTYVVGTGTYTTSWTGRAALTYVNYAVAWNAANMI